jgi:hypothetical protein
MPLGFLLSLELREFLIGHRLATNQPVALHVDFKYRSAFPAFVRADITLIGDGKAAAGIALGAGNID